MTDDLTQDLKQIRISKVTLGLILGVVTFSAVITWNAAQVANRITGLERSVAVIEQNTGTDSAVLARLDAIETGIETNATSLENLRLARVADSRNFATSVMVELMAADVAALTNEVAEFNERLEEIGWELGDLWWRTDMNEQACRTRAWCDEWYDENW
tara:strand:- start:348 stop:821 length:474 start_codon:yes stop_codon:yes gene_type:complete